jgi:glycosyltransferase involved in cell wall biosynthesis
MSRRILLVSYFFPPSRDTGALRPAAMAKYLRRLGHEVEVVTTAAYGDDGDPAAHRTRDAQLWRARRAGKETVDTLFDADTYGGEPHLLSKVIVPEPLALAWAPFARREALRLHRHRPFDAVVTTSPPESVHAVGMALRRRGVPWIADVRDGWTFEPLRPDFPTSAQRGLDRRLERRWLGAADVVVCVSHPAAEDLRQRRIADPLVITNGWDPEAAPEPAAAPAGVFDPDRFSLLYTGRFGSFGRDPGPLVAAIARLADRKPETAARLELVIAGPLTEEEARLFSRDLAPARIVLAGSLRRAQALALQRQADALLLIAQPTRTQLLNIKVFEYLAAQRPILALAAGTDAGRVIAETGGEVVKADDESAIAEALAGLVDSPPEPPDAEAVAEYTYPSPAERLAEAVERAIG